jgi:hypothetical protein
MATKPSEPLLSETSPDEEMVQTRIDNLQLFKKSDNSNITPKNPDLEPPKFESLEVEQGHMSPTTGTLVADSRSPLEAYCIFCKKNIITEITFHTGRSTHIMGGLLCCLGFYCCCCCLPYHMKDCKDVRHKCPICDEVIKIEKFRIL